MDLLVTSYTDCINGKRDPLLVETLPRGESLLVLADGSEMALAHSYQPVMDLVGESFLNSLSRSMGPIPERLRQAEGDLETLMRQRFPSSDRFEENTFSATFLAALISGGQAFFTWIGSQQAKLFRSRRSVWETTPHVTVVPATDRGEFIVTSRVVSTAAGEVGGPPQIEGPWSLASGDVLVIADYRLFHLLPDDEIAAIIATAPASAAQALVEEAQRRQRHFMRSALVARVAS
jgi:hypothetical protein